MHVRFGSICEPVVLIVTGGQGGDREGAEVGKLCFQYLNDSVFPSKLPPSVV